MKSTLTRLVVLMGLALWLGGCVSYDAQMERGRSLNGIKRFFVLSNLNDNHGIDHQIVVALKARGREAEAGPLTMMPDDTQAIISYADNWGWDFADHLSYFKLEVRDPRSEQPFGIVTFSAKIPLHEDAAVTVARLVDQLLNKK